MSRLKLYIALKDTVPSKMAPVICAHAAMNAVEEFKDDPVFQQWNEFSFKKVIVSVNEKSFNKMKEIPRAFTQSESSTLDNEPCCVVIPVMEEYPNVVKFAKLWSA